MNDIGDKHKTHKNTIIGKPEKENNLYPGKAPASEYFKYIDIESNLKSLNLPNSITSTTRAMRFLVEGFRLKRQG